MRELKTEKFLCSDGLIVWHGLRGIDNKLTYQTWDLENFYTVPQNMEFIIAKLKKRDEG